MNLNLDTKSKIELGKRLREAREQKKLTQEEVATKSGITTSYYARIERGEEQPSLATLKSLAKTLNIKGSQIVPF